MFLAQPPNAQFMTSLVAVVMRFRWQFTAWFCALFAPVAGQLTELATLDGLPNGSSGPDFDWIGEVFGLQGRENGV